MRNTLNVWLHGSHIGEIQRLRNGRNRLRFSSDAIRTWGAGTHLLSYSLPLTMKRVESAALDAYLDNLLPEGLVRVQLEQQYRVHPGDAFELLSHIGGECAGAVQLTVDNDSPLGRLVPLSESEVNRIVEELPTLSPPPGETVNASLGGVQSKVLLTRVDGGWAWPAGGAMSTHIIKPEPIDPSASIPRIIEYEHWAMRLAAAAGVPVAATELVRFGERLALVVERYDRTNGVRLHQEDFAQALGIRPGAKYEPSNEPTTRLARIATGPGAESLDPEAFHEFLLRLVTFNAVIGNGDAHAKNYALFLRDGVFELAPAYDLAPVFCINNQFADFGMRIATQRNLRYLTPAQLVEEAVSWNMTLDKAQRVVKNTAESVRIGLESVPTIELTEQIAARATSFAFA